MLKSDGTLSELTVEDFVLVGEGQLLIANVNIDSYISEPIGDPLVDDFAIARGNRTIMSATEKGEKKHKIVDHGNLPIPPSKPKN